MPKLLRIFAIVVAVVFAALALTVVVAAPAAAPLEDGISMGIDAPEDAVEHAVRPGVRAAALIPLVLLGALAVAPPLVRRRVAVIRRRHRRIGDVGDDWRALLLGAPPIAA